ncbi:SCO3933 family regulatory protein, partial [Nonomuraea rubra]
ARTACDALPRTYLFQTSVSLCSRLSGICWAPQVLNKDTGEIKTDKNGNTVYEVTVSVEDEFGRIELVKIGITGEPPITVGDQVNAVGLLGYVWELTGRWGIAYRANALLPIKETADA